MTVKKSGAWMVVALCAAACALSGCVSGSSYTKPGYDFHSAGKVAVIVTSAVGDPAQQQEIADLFAMQVLSKGYDVIDRANIADLTKEAEFQNASGITSPEGRAKLAIHNVSSVIVVNVVSPNAGPRYVRVRGYWYWAYGGWVWYPSHWVLVNPGGPAEDVSMTAKMVDVQTGTLLWVGEGSGSLKGGLAPVGGELLGAGAGAVAGAVIGGTRGAILGGLAGVLTCGVAGAALEPSAAELLRKVIARTCEGLPSLAPKQP
jgi:outer membrane lipoprotein SlyB